MDSRTFDRLIAEAAQPSRRGALRLLAAGLLGGALAGRWAAPAAAQPRPDVDYDADGLTNDDEVNVYGTDPSSSNTDGDGLNDGEEISYGRNPLYAPPPGAVEIGDVNSGGNADGAIGVGDTWGVTCRGVGLACNYDNECCNAAVRCCWDGVSLQTECTDVTPYGGICPV